MALVLDQEQRLLKQAVRDFLKEKAPVSALRELRDTRDETGFSRGLWREMAEMGWAGILIPEEYGGIGFGHVAAGLVFEEMGRTLAVSPMLSTAVLGATALLLGGTDAQKRALLPEIAAGDRLLALAVDEGPRHGPAQIAFGPEKTGAGYRLNGTKTFVLDGHVADTLVVAARTSGPVGDREGVTLFLVEREQAGLEVERIQNLDSRNAANINFRDVEVAGDAVLGRAERGMEILEPLLDLSRICLASEMLGIARECFARTVSYLKDRRQFGVPIGSFQALQHRAAQVFCEIELTRSVVLHALQSLDEGSNRVREMASLAKVKSGATVRLATNEAIQMHGGIGMTDELDLGFFVKRARAAQETFGGWTYHADRYARIHGY